MDASHTSPPPAHRPLQGVRVVDLSRYLPGPFCALQLAWLGADVVCIEQPPFGDPLRAMPPLASDGTSLSYRSLRRDAAVELLDLATAEGLERARTLIADADVLIESFRPGVASRLGLGADALRTSNPGLIYCSISGYGQSGPWANAPGHDIGYEAAAGLLEQSGTPEHVTLPAVPMADLAGGFAAATAICAALVRRAATGAGCELDISLTESALALQAMQLPGASSDAGSRQGSERGRGMLTGGLASYRPYRCADGEWLAIGPIEPKFFATLTELLGRPELGELQHDPARQDELRDELASCFAQRASRDWEELLVGTDGGGSCVVRALHPSELHQHPQHAARGALHPVSGEPGSYMPASPYVVDGVRSDSVADQS